MLASLSEFDIPSFETTPYGILAYLPVIEHHITPRAFIAILSYIKNGGGRLVGLQLFQCLYGGRARQKIPVFQIVAFCRSHRGFERISSGPWFAGRIMDTMGILIASGRYTCERKPRTMQKKARP